jgi:hypothetical protein
MSTQISTAFVNQYAATVFHLAQQQGSRLRPTVRNESQVGNVAFWDRIGKVTAQKKTGRHSDTPQTDTPHSRRMVSLVDYEHADLVDNADKIRLLIDPTSEYMKAFANAFGRAMDDEIIAAAVGTAYSGVAGATSVTFPNSQIVANVSGGAGSNLTVDGLRAAKRILDANECDPSEKRYLVISASQISSLLNQTQVTSSDYASIKALDRGDINSFMGFDIIHSERLTTVTSSTSFNTSTGAVGSGSGDANGYRRCLAFCESGLLLSIGQDYKGRISERADKGYAMQAYACMGIGATRLEEEKVVQILCNES